MARASRARPQWAEEFLKEWHPPTDDEIRRRREVIERALKLRETADISPLTTSELVREIRENEEDA